MRLWSLHPKYLDSKGLVAVWREGLLAKKVLEGKTRGYTKHPQLLRFRDQPNPVDTIERYLASILAEANSRGYAFDATKIRSVESTVPELTVTSGQLAFETSHLLRKLQMRDAQKFDTVSLESQLVAHPIFSVVPGPVERWEVVYAIMNK